MGDNSHKLGDNLFRDRDVHVGYKCATFLTVALNMNTTMKPRASHSCVAHYLMRMARLTNKFMYCRPTSYNNREHLNATHVYTANNIIRLLNGQNIHA